MALLRSLVAWSRASAAAAALAVAGCGSGMHVHSVVAPDAHFDRYHTVAFDVSSAPPSRYGASPRTAARIADAAARVLESRGYDVVSGSKADLVVRVAAGHRVEAEPMSNGSMPIGADVAGVTQPPGRPQPGAPRGAPALTPGPALVSPAYHGELDQEQEDLVNRAIVIDAFDGNTGAMVWHGAARGREPPGSFDDEQLRRAVASVLATFPRR